MKNIKVLVCDVSKDIINDIIAMYKNMIKAFPSTTDICVTLY